MSTLGSGNLDDAVSKRRQRLPQEDGSVLYLGKVVAAVVLKAENWAAMAGGQGQCDYHGYITGISAYADDQSEPQ
jgi:hypothetical protein